MRTLVSSSSAIPTLPTLVRNILTRSSAATVSMSLEGSYGQCNFVSSLFSSVLVVAGGSGVSFALSVAESVVRDVQSGRGNTKELVVVWSVREPGEEILRTHRIFLRSSRCIVDFFSLLRRRHSHHSPLPINTRPLLISHLNLFQSQHHRPHLLHEPSCCRRRRSVARRLSGHRALEFDVFSNHPRRSHTYSLVRSATTAQGDSQRSDGSNKEGRSRRCLLWTVSLLFLLRSLH